MLFTFSCFYDLDWLRFVFVNNNLLLIVVSDYMDEEYHVELKVKNEPPKFQNLQLVPKEEEMDEEEFDKMMEERFKNNPTFRHVEDADGTAMERNSILASTKDPTVWKVKCMVGYFVFPLPLMPHYLFFFFLFFVLN